VNIKQATMIEEDMRWILVETVKELISDRMAERVRKFEVVDVTPGVAIVAMKRAYEAGRASNKD
jgi:hypothetical protein